MKLPKQSIKQWTDKSYSILFKSNNEPKDITGYEVYFVVRKRSTLPEKTNDSVVIDKTAVIVDWTTGVATINLYNNETKDIPVWDYLYEISFKNTVNWVYSHYGYGDFNISYLSNKI